MQSEWRLQVFSLPFTLHWRCNISENLLFVRLWREFIVNLWVNWNLGCLKNCFQSTGRIFIVCARCFSAFCACPELCYDIERPKVLKFWVGCVHTSILTICVCFSNCCFGILMLGVRTRVSLSNRVFNKLIRAVSVRLWRQLAKTSREASGNTNTNSILIVLRYTYTIKKRHHTPVLAVAKLYVHQSCSVTHTRDRIHIIDIARHRWHWQVSTLSCHVTKSKGRPKATCVECQHNTPTS